MMTQAPPETVWHWLYTNAPAAWISAIAAVTTLVVLQLRKRPKRVVVREFPSISFLRALPSMKHRIKTTFDGKPADALSMVGYEIHNEGSDPIKNAEFTLVLPPQAVVLGASIGPHDSEPKCEFTDNLVTVSLPYLNPFHEHKQLITLLIVADGETSHAKVNGGGEGWSVRFSPLPGRRQMKKLYLVPATAGAISGGVMVAYMRFLGHVLKIAPPQVTGRVLLAAVPALTIFAAAILISQRVMAQLWYRAIRPQMPSRDPDPPADARREKA
jgi:hypothetical protein